MRGDRANFFANQHQGLDAIAGGWREIPKIDDRTSRTRAGRVVVSLEMALKTSLGDRVVLVSTRAECNHG